MSKMRKYLDLFLRKKYRISFILVLVIISIPMVITLNNYQSLVRYRFFVLKPHQSQHENIKWLKRSFADALAMTAYQASGTFDHHDNIASNKVPSIFLKVDPGSTQKMASNLPDSAKEKYYRAYMLYPDNTWKKIKYRFRGRNFWHWMPEKPSLRLKLSKKNPLDLQVAINLVNPEDRSMMINIFNDRLAEKFGVLTLAPGFVNLYINGQFRGLYQSTLAETEEFLRSQNRIPGPLFIGERLNKTWHHKDFEQKGELKTIKKVNPLEIFIKTLNSPNTPQKFDKLWSILNKKKTAAWLSTLTLVGGSHTDYHHNHIYYFDPTLGKIEPVTSDINGNGMLYIDKKKLKWRDIPITNLPINELLHPLSNVAYRDPTFYKLRNETLYAALRSFASTTSQHQIVEKLNHKIKTSVYNDKYKASLDLADIGYFRFPYSNWLYDVSIKELKTWIKRRNQFLLDKLTETKVHVSILQEKKRSFLLVQVTGHAGVNFSPKVFNGKVYGLSPKDIKQSKLITQEEFLAPGLKKQFSDCAGGRRSSPYCLMPGSQNYLLQVNHTNAQELKEQLSAAFGHNLTKEKIKPEITIANKKINIDDIKYNQNSLHVWNIPHTQTKQIIIEPGITKINKDLYIGKHDLLLVKAGAQLLLSPGVSIISEGKVTFAGTKQNRIKVKRAQSSRPWGVIAIHGEHANESSITYTDFDGGSKEKALNVSYSGMVSVHGLSSIEIRNSSFSNNTKGDDTFHAVYGKVKMRDVTFAGCYSDCIDVDYAALDLKEGKFIRPGNDGVDLMTSNATIENVEISNSGDKGISIGEKSIATIINSSIRNSSIGAAIKDGSQANFEKVTFEKNLYGISAYSKNWRYGKPGSAEVKESLFQNNNVDIQAEEFSKIIMHQEIPQNLEGDGIVRRK